MYKLHVVTLLNIQDYIRSKHHIWLACCTARAAARSSNGSPIASRMPRTAARKYEMSAANCRTMSGPCLGLLQH